MGADFVDSWVRRNAAERPSSVVPSALERLAFMHGGAGQALGTEWAQLSEKDAAHLSGLLEIVVSTGDLEVRRALRGPWVAGVLAACQVELTRAHLDHSCLCRRGCPCRVPAPQSLQSLQLTHIRLFPVEKG